MRFIQISLSAVLLLSAVPALAHDDGACKAYADTCKSDPSVTGATDKKAKWEAMHSCIKAAATADTANGAKCVAHMSHHGHMHGGGTNTGAAPAPAQ